MSADEKARSDSVRMLHGARVDNRRDVSLEAQRARKRRNSKAGRARRKRGQYRRTLTIPGAQLRRLAELGYLERVDDPVAQVRALEASHHRFAMRSR